MSRIDWRTSEPYLEALARYRAAREAWRNAQGSEAWARTQRAMRDAAENLASTVSALAELDEPRGAP